jgi:hypothetical protein
MEHELNAMDLFLEPRSEGDELLHEAFNFASRDMLEQLRQLLDCGAAKQLDCTGLVNGFTMAHTAAKKGHERILAFLLDRFPVLRDAPTKDGRHVAMDGHAPKHDGAVAGAWLCLFMSVDVVFRARMGGVLCWPDYRSISQPTRASDLSCSCCMIEAQTRRRPTAVAIRRCTLLAGQVAWSAQSELQTARVWSPCVCSSPNIGMCRFLVEQMGADVSARTHEQMTALQFASAGNHLNIVKFLQDQSAALNTANSGSGQTPLHKACMFGSLETVRHLIENDPV